MLQSQFVAISWCTQPRIHLGKDILSILRLLIIQKHLCSICSGRYRPGGQPLGGSTSSCFRATGWHRFPNARKHASMLAMVAAQSSPSTLGHPQDETSPGSHSRRCQWCSPFHRHRTCQPLDQMISISNGFVAPSKSEEIQTRLQVSGFSLLRASSVLNRRCLVTSTHALIVVHLVNHRVLGKKLKPEPKA